MSVDKKSRKTKRQQHQANRADQRATGYGRGSEAQVGMEPLLLTATEAAEVLHISRTKVFELKSQNRLKYIKIGQALRFRPSDLEEFVQDLADSAAKEASKHKFNLP